MKRASKSIITSFTMSRTYRPPPPFPFLHLLPSRSFLLTSLSLPLWHHLRPCVLKRRKFFFPSPLFSRHPSPSTRTRLSGKGRERGGGQVRGRDGRRRVSLREPSSRKKLKLRRVPTIHLPLVARVNATLCTPYSSPNLMSAQRAPPEHWGLPFFF